MRGLEENRCQEWISKTNITDTANQPWSSMANNATLEFIDSRASLQAKTFGNSLFLEQWQRAVFRGRLLARTLSTCSRMQMIRATVLFLYLSNCQKHPFHVFNENHPKANTHRVNRSSRIKRSKRRATRPCCFSPWDKAKFEQRRFRNETKCVRLFYEARVNIARYLLSMMLARSAPIVEFRAVCSSQTVHPRLRNREASHERIITSLPSIQRQCQK